jgi:hypothetical protein
VVVAWVQGGTFIEEAMAQYSALMVMEKDVGPIQIKRFLAYELDRYLSGRARERREERPLLTVENQGYIHYRKGSLATYALKDYIGEDAFNRAMGRYVADVGFAGPPYTTSLEYLDYLTAEVPERWTGVVEDLFRTITLWELQAEDVTWEPTDDGRYRVRLTVSGRKYRTDGEGNETEVPLDDWVDIGVFGVETDETPEQGAVLFLEKRRVTATDTVFEVVVDAEPRRGGIDPFNKLIDRNPENNVTGASAG